MRACSSLYSTPPHPVKEHRVWISVSFADLTSSATVFRRNWDLRKWNCWWGGTAVLSKSYSAKHFVFSLLMQLFLFLQWKVRRTLAFSIHELAVILGDQLTAIDLVPIFNGFLKDLDEVRIGVLKHLHDFLKVTLILLHKNTLKFR